MREAGSRAPVSLVLLLVILSLSGAGFEVFGIPGNAVMAVLSILGFLWLGFSAWRKTPERPAARQIQVSFFAGSVLLIALLAVYYLNPTHRWAEGIGALPVRHIRWLPGTAFASGTLQALCFSTIALTAGGLAMTLGRKEVKILVFTLVLVAAVTSLVTIGQRLTPRPYPIFELTGFFTYENHFAAFANLILPAALCSAARQRIHAFQSGRISSPAGVLLLAAVIMGIAVAISRSRAGLAVTGLIFTVFICRQLWLHRRYPFMIPPVSLLSKISIGAGSLAVFCMVMIRMVREWISLTKAGQELPFRWQVLSDVVSMWRSHIWWGTGPGSFAAVFPYYQSLPPEKHFFAHAHCEPLELLAEYGLLGTGIFLAALAIILLFRRCHNAQNNSNPPFMELEGCGLILALCGVGLHSLADFPLRHPLNALLVWVWVGILSSRASGFLTMKFIQNSNGGGHPDGETK